MSKDADHTHSHGLPTQRDALVQEIVHHLPFSVSAVALGLTLAGIICFLYAGHQELLTAHEAAHPGTETMPADEHDSHEHAAPVSEEGHDHDHDHDHDHGDEGAHEHDGHDHGANPFLSLFHLFHPMHMLFSGAATTAMFWRYERRWFKAVLVGLIGAIGVCGLSDIFMPHVSLMLLGKHMPLHICVIKHPQMVLSFAIVGVLIGLAASSGVTQSTFFSHSLHVFSSSMASIFYMIGPFGVLGWTDLIGAIFLFVIIAVMIPCCLSDIVFPLLLARGARNRFQDEHEHGSCCG